METAFQAFSDLILKTAWGGNSLEWFVKTQTTDTVTEKLKNESDDE